MFQTTFDSPQFSNADYVFFLEPTMNVASATLRGIEQVISISKPRVFVHRVTSDSRQQTRLNGRRYTTLGQRQGEGTRSRNSSDVILGGSVECARKGFETRSTTMNSRRFPVNSFSEQIVIKSIINYG